MKTKRFLSYLLTLALLAGLVPWTALPARADGGVGKAGSFAELEALLGAGGTVVLDRDYVAGEDEIRMDVPANVTVTLDLNGHAVDRGLTGADAEGFGYILQIRGNLTLTDSAGGGRFVGGHDGGGCSGVYVAGGATFTMNGGTICGNRADGAGGGGVYVDEGTFRVSGGAVVAGNTAGGAASDVYLAGNSRITVVGALTASASIGVTMQTPGAFAQGGGYALTAGDAARFFSDSAAYGVVFADGAASLSSVWTTVDSWSGLQTALNGGGLVRLGCDCKAGSGDAALTVPADVNVTLDLNGHVLDRGFGVYDSDYKGHIFMVRGGLTLCDSGTTPRYGYLKEIILEHDDELEIITTYELTTEQPSEGEYDTFSTGGVIWGGGSDDDCGGVYVDGGVFTMLGGALTRSYSSVNGGGVYVDGGAFTMNGGTISGNYGNYGGGGVCITGGAFTMNGGTLFNNNVEWNDDTVYGGGVLVVGGGFLMNGGVLTENIVHYLGEVRGGGGGVCVRSGAFMMKGGAISGNRAASAGGVLVMESGVLFASGDPAISGNTADEAASNVYLRDGNKIVVNGALRNTVPIGVAMPAPGVFAVAAETYQNGRLTDNDAARFAGEGTAKFVELDESTGQLGLHSVPNAAAQIGGVEYATLQDALNAATDGDTIGLLRNVTVDSTVEIADGKNVTFDLNDHGILYVADDEEYSVIAVRSGAALTLEDRAGTKTTRYVTLDEDGRGTGIETEEPDGTEGEDYLTVTGGYITGGWDNFANGGGVLVKGTLNMTGGTICGNIETDSGGGGVRVKEGGTFTMSGGTIRGNRALQGGGGVYVSGENASFDMSKTAAVSDNRVSGGENGGGGVRVSKGTFTMRGGEITGNSITGEEGGGVYLEEGGTFTMSGGAIHGNVTSEEGGGVRVDEGTFTMSGGTIRGNSAYRGGGVYFSDGAFRVSGGARVTGNMADGAVNNVWLDTDDCGITVVGELTGTLGVTAVRWDEGAETYVPSTDAFARAAANYSLTDADVGCFTSDNDACGVTRDGDAAVLYRLLPAIRDAVLDGSTLSCTVTGVRQNARLIAAWYDASGRLLGMKVSDPIAANTASQQVTFTGVGTGAGYTCKLMLVDAATYAPLCAAWDSSKKQ